MTEWYSRMPHGKTRQNSTPRPLLVLLLKMQFACVTCKQIKKAVYGPRGLVEVSDLSGSTTRKTR